MSQTQAALGETEQHPDAVQCECYKCDSTDLIPHMPEEVVQVPSDDGDDDDEVDVVMSPEPRVCWSCAGSRAHWQAREDARLDEMPDEPFSSGAEWGAL